MFGAGAALTKDPAMTDLGPLHAKIGEQALQIEFHVAFPDKLADKHPRTVAIRFSHGL